jgi:26S proteasome regulatory subunit N1
LLKEKLEAAVEQTKSADADVVKTALELMAKEIRETTTTMTAVPKPLKFLTPRYASLVEAYQV